MDPVLAALNSATQESPLDARNYSEDLAQAKALAEKGDYATCYTVVDRLTAKCMVKQKAEDLGIALMGVLQTLKSFSTNPQAA